MSNAPKLREPRTHVTLVATPEAIYTHFPGATGNALIKAQTQEAASGPLVASFPVDPVMCSTSLGKWLASVIPSTRFSDPGSQCRILLPNTDEDFQLREFARHLLSLVEKGPEIFDRASFDNVHKELEVWSASRKLRLEAVGEKAFAYRVVDFHWPVLGSRAAGGVVSVEAYFEECARQIRATGGVILEAGPDREPLPEHIASTMWSNRGLALLAAYEQQHAAWPEDQAEGTAATSTPAQR